MASKRDAGNPSGSDHYGPHETRLNKAVPTGTRPIPLSRPRIPDLHPSEHRLLPDELRVMIEHDALMRQHAIDHPYKDVADMPTGILPKRRSAREIEDLKHAWLSHPTWDIEFSAGFELHFNELAAWHDEQLWNKAKALGCSHLMASILEELVRCWIHDEPPRSPHGLRILASYS